MHLAPRTPLVGHESRSSGNQWAVKCRICLKSAQRQVQPKGTPAGRSVVGSTELSLTTPARGGDSASWRPDGRACIGPGGLSGVRAAVAPRIYYSAARPTPVSDLRSTRRTPTTDKYQQAQSHDSWLDTQPDTPCDRRATSPPNIIKHVRHFS